MWYYIHNTINSDADFHDPDVTPTPRLQEHQKSKTGLPKLLKG